MQVVAWIAALLVFLSFFMKTIVPLRVLAIASNVAFVAYALLGIQHGIFDKVLPILVLHLALLPLNILRLREVKRSIREVRRETDAPPSLEFLKPYMTIEKFDAGHMLFRKGDAADRLYLIDEGQIRLVELNKLLPPGSVFGELGVFSEKEARLASARCESDCKLYSLTGSKAVELFYQDPRFGFYIVRTLARYLTDPLHEPPAAPSPQAQDAEPGIPATATAS